MAGEEYLGLRVFRFYIRCPRCSNEIAFKVRLQFYQIFFFEVRLLSISDNHTILRSIPALYCAMAVHNSTVCLWILTQQTDPKNADYTCELGATRNFEHWRVHDKDVEAEEKAKEEEEEMNPMAVG